MHYSLVIFDCDGTLVDSEHLNLVAIIELLADFGISGYDTDYGMEHFSGISFGDIMDIVAKEKGFTFPNNIAELYVEKIASMPSNMTRKIAGVDEVVQVAKSNAKICVASNGEAQNVVSSLDNAGLRKYFDDAHIFTVKMVSKPKPYPELFLLAAKQMEVEPAQTLVIEDSIAGVIAAKAANMDVWGFAATHPDPKNHADQLIKNGADKVYSAMKEIEKDLNKAYTKV